MPEHIDSDLPMRATDDHNDDSPRGANGIQRRDFLKLMGGALGGFVIVSLGPPPATFEAAPGLASRFLCLVPDSGPEVLNTPYETLTSVAKNLAKFVDPLPIPGILQPTGTYQGKPLYEVSMRQFTQKLHRDLPPTTLWGYEGLYPGPTISVEQGKPIAVRWMNKLPAQHLFTRDTTLHGDEADKPPVRTVVHVHGVKVLPESDGYPEAWFTKNFNQTGPTFSQEIYEYPNEQAATTLWYHDHALGLTRLNVYAGLAGFYLIHSDKERALNLPSGAYDIPLVIQDRMFNPDGSLVYPVVDLNGDSNPNVPPIWVPEFFGDTILVNGKVWPYLEVEPRKYRFRVLNGSNSRFYNLFLQVGDGTREAPRLNVIGTDGGFLSKPAKRKQILMSPAERYDVVIDFSGYENARITMHNDARATYPLGNAHIPKQIMQFRVKSRMRNPDTSDLPKTLYPVPALNPASAVTTRDITFAASFSAGGHAIMWRMNGEWTDPIQEEPHAGDIEIWRIINKTGQAHPFHLHLVQFQVLDRQPVVVAESTNEITAAGPAEMPPVDEATAWKDTIIAHAKTITRVIAKFDLPKGADTTPGTHHRYVYHCHMIEHEDNEMMRPYDVVS